MEGELPEELTQSRAINIDFPISRRSGDVVLRTEGLTKRYDNLEVVKPLTTLMQRGKRWGIIGANGAGKTTLLRLIARSARANPRPGDARRRG